MKRLWWGLLPCLQKRWMFKRWTVKCLPNILFKIDITDLCLLPCFCILFKRQLENVTKLFMYEVVLTTLKISEPIMWQMWHTINRKKECISLIVELSLKYFTIERSRIYSLEVEMFSFLSFNSEGYIFLLRYIFQWSSRWSFMSN